MKNSIKLSLMTLTTLVFISFGVQAISADAKHASNDDAGWEAYSDDGKIKIYTKYLEGKSLKAFKVVTKVKAELPQVLMYLNDTSQLSEWVFMLESAKIIQDTDPQGVSYNHMITKVPWPIRDRDVVVKTFIEYDKSLGEVRMSTEAAPDFIEEDDKLVRIRESASSWKINKLADGELRLELISHAEPGGAIPKWLANMVVTKLPQHMFERLPELLESEETSKLEFDAMKIFGREIEL